MRPIAIIMALISLILAGCSTDQAGPPKPIGDFALGHMVVVAKHLQAAPGSRAVPNETWAQTTRQAVRQRLGRYDGDRLYNVALSLDAYLLAPPGIPIVLAPKSAIVARISVWDDAQNRLMTPKPVQISVLEKLEAKSVLGKGLFLDGDAQMQELSEQLARRVENWLRNQHDENGWFEQDGPARDDTIQLDDPIKVDQVQISEPAAPQNAPQTVLPTAPPAMRPAHVALAHVPAPKLRP